MNRRLPWILRIYRDSLAGLPPRVWLLCGVFLINRAGTMVVPFLSLYMTVQLGFTIGEAGWVLGAFGLGSVVGSYLGGQLSQRIGAVTVQKLALVSVGAAFLVLTQLETLPTLMVGVFVVSLVGEGFRPAALAAVAEAAPKEVRTRSLGLVRLAASAGQAIGPALGGLLASLDYRWIFVGDTATCWLAAVLLVVFLPDRESSEDRKARAAARRPGSVWDDTFFLWILASIFLFACIIFQFTGAFPLYLHEGYGLNEETIGLVLGFNALLVVIFEMPLVRWLEKRNHARLVGLGSFLTCLGFSLMPLGDSVAFALFTVAVWSFGMMLVLPFSNALVAECAGEGRSGEYMGVYTAAFSSALLLGPPLGLWIYGRFGPQTLWLLVGLLGPVLWLVGERLAKRQRESQEEVRALP
ncbi:MAG: MFS transporter [Deltaproteobacteria bacterium]|nr:MFS transporter [Deltaproteobacteria bacterium]